MADPFFLALCASLLGFAVLIGFALSPSQETTSISQRLEGLKSSGQQRTKTSLRDEEEMGKSPFARVVVPMLEKMSKLFSAMTPNTSIERARVSIMRAGLQGKVFPYQITTAPTFS